MEFKIRKIKEEDKKEILSMMEEFYSSDAVYTNGSREIFENDFEQCINSSPYLEGYVFENDGKILGYGMIAKSFSTEFGKHCIWFEDLYIKAEFRGKGIISEYIKFIEKAYSEAVFRLEAEEDNTRAIYVYKKAGFETLPYMEMIKR